MVCTVKRQLFESPLGAIAVRLNASNIWIVMNVNPPRLGSVTVNGKLSFQRGRGADSNLTLYTDNLIVYGAFEINFSNRSADGVADVVLTGDMDSSDPVLIGEGIFPGSKVIAVPGQLTLIGQSVASTWVRLQSTANFGSTEVVVRGVMNDWRRRSPARRRSRRATCCRPVRCGRCTWHSPIRGCRRTTSMAAPPSCVSPGMSSCCCNHNNELCGCKVG